MRPVLNASAAVSFGLSRPNAVGFAPSETNSVASSPDTCASRAAVFCGSASDATGAASFHTSRPSGVFSCLSANPLAPSTVTPVSRTLGSAVPNSLRLRYATGSRRKVGSRRSGNSFAVSQPGAGGPPMRSLTSATRGHPASCTGSLPAAMSGVPMSSLYSRGASGSPSGRFSRAVTVTDTPAAGSRPRAFGSARYRSVSSSPRKPARRASSSSTRAASAGSGFGFWSISQASSRAEPVAFGSPFLRVSTSGGLPGCARVTACTSSGLNRATRASTTSPAFANRSPSFSAGTVNSCGLPSNCAYR